MKVNAKHILTKIETLIKSSKQYVTKENVFTLFCVLFLLWSILYFIPDVLLSLFGTLLGNLLLIVAAILAFATNWKYGVVFTILAIILYRLYYLSTLSKKKEAFQQQNVKILTPKSIRDFLWMQTTLNRNTNFDTDRLQQQVTQEELDNFLKHGTWYWSPKTIQMYKDAFEKNVFIRNYPSESIKRAKQTYNEAAILQLLSMQTPEGRALIDGVTIHNKNNNNNPLETLPDGFGSFGYTSGLVTPLNDEIKCNIDPFSNNSYIEKKHYTGKDGIFGQQTSVTTPIDYHNLEKEIPGFRFLNGPCNPCKLFNSTPDYSCPFEIHSTFKKG